MHIFVNYVREIVFRCEPQRVHFVFKYFSIYFILKKRIYIYISATALFNAFHLCLCVWYFYQVFDILPLFGTLDPGESQQVQLTFYGHAWVSASVVALCHVEGGPTYQIPLRGEASVIKYHIDKRIIPLGTVVRPCYNLLYIIGIVYVCW